MKIRIKSRQTGPSKFKSEWSGPHEVVAVRGVLVTVKELSTGRTYHIHHDRLSNPVFTGKFHPRFTATVVSPHEANANPRENPKESEEDSRPTTDPAAALARTRSGRAIRPYHDPQFDYTSILLDYNQVALPSSTNLRVHLSQIIHSFFHHAFLMSRHLPHQPSPPACLTFVRIRSGSAGETCGTLARYR